jgi:hypothetical protein
MNKGSLMGVVKPPIAAHAPCPDSPECGRRADEAKQRTSDAMSDRSYNVGYGKPPKRSQFHKGVSGNRKGLPKGKRNMATVLTEILEREIVIKEGGVRKKVTKLEAVLKQLVDKAVLGDLAAARQLIPLACFAGERTAEPSRKHLSEDDLKIMKRVLQREGSCLKGETSDDH